MTGGGEEIGGLCVDSFELIGDLEDLDCSVDAGADGREGIWCWDYHLGSMGEWKALGLLENMNSKAMDVWTSLKGFSKMYFFHFCAKRYSTLLRREGPLDIRWTRLSKVRRVNDRG